MELLTIINPIAAGLGVYVYHLIRTRQLREDLYAYQKLHAMTADQITRILISAARDEVEVNGPVPFGAENVICGSNLPDPIPLEFTNDQLAAAGLTPKVTKWSPPPGWEQKKKADDSGDTTNLIVGAVVLDALLDSGPAPMEPMPYSEPDPAPSYSGDSSDSGYSSDSSPSDFGGGDSGGGGADSFFGGNE